MKELIDMLTGSLGVNTAQAEGGAAVLFKAAKDKLGEGEFSKLLGSVPGLADLLKKAPPAGGGGFGGLLGGLAGAVGGNAALIGTIVGGFGKLGLGTDDAKRFVPVIMDFLRKKVGPDVVARLEKTLRG
ncbi:MAG TPA: DUF2780 domain-containing protein [Steroidobacteraceae bacterium]|nr:DUF2780 domain-containing protein [Steroidobacteraceae bacterium]